MRPRFWDAHDRDCNKEDWGRPYTYFEWYEEGKTVQKYCGPAGSTKARKRAVELEIELIKKRSMLDRKRMRELRKELRSILKE